MKKQALYILAMSSLVVMLALLAPCRFVDQNRNRPAVRFHRRK